MEIYHFYSEWHFDAPLPDVQEELENLENWPTWSSEIRNASVRGGGRLRTGAIADVEVKGPLPFVLRFTIEMTDYHPAESATIRSIGDLVGGGSWSLEPANGGTRVKFHWHVGLKSPVLNFLSRLAPVKALMEQNHHWVMRRTYNGLNEKLRSKNREQVAV
ncbi:MAG: SRPBCC family protein [Anaerolineales bacterium]|nr:SRPBCC family protein [Anaerolineales bacterium]